LNKYRLKRIGLWCRGDVDILIRYAETLMRCIAVTAFILVIIFPATLQASAPLVSSKEKTIIGEAENILSKIFSINTTRYSLVKIYFAGGSEYYGATIKNYLIIYRGINNQSLILDTYTLHGYIVRLMIIGSPLFYGCIEGAQPKIKTRAGGIVLDTSILKDILNNTIGLLHGIYGCLANSTQHVLRITLHEITSSQIVLSGKTGYRYMIILPGNYIFEVSGDQLELSISLIKQLSLPLGIIYRERVLYIHFYIVNGKLCGDIFSYNPLLPGARVFIPEKLWKVSVNAVIKRAGEILEKYLARNGIKNYSIISVKPEQIGIKEYVENWSLTIVPSTDLVLTASVKTGSGIRHYLVYLNLDTMDGLVKGEYINIVHEGENMAAVPESNTVSPWSQGALTLLIALIATGAIMGLCLYSLKRVQKK